MAETSWLIGSAQISEQTVTISASPEVIAAGRYYLRDPSAPALLTAMVTAMTAAGLSNPYAVLLVNRKVRLGADATFTVTWPADNILRNLLGYAGNLVGAQTYDAGLSPLLWSPGRTESSNMAPLGVTGHEVFNTEFGVGNDGTTSSVSHGSRRFNDFWWSHIATDRVQTEDEEAGEWVRFFSDVARKALPFKLYRGVAENVAASTTATLGTPLGPYALTPSSRSVDWKFQRSTGFERADGRNTLEIKVHMVPEIT